ncbi:MAG: thioredoxin-like domain-containing protein [Lutibacter sp.]
MTKKLLLGFLMLTQIISAQHIVTGQMKPSSNRYNWVILYQLKGSKQFYIGNSTLKDGAFQIKIPQNSEKGMYRIMYKMDQKSQIDFIYNYEDINLTFNPLKPISSVQYSNSDENEWYADYRRNSRGFQSVLDSIQMESFKGNANSTELEKIYETKLTAYKKMQQGYDNKTIGLQVNHFIKAEKVYYPETLIESPKAYLTSKKNHYFDYINFNDQVLQNSIFFSEKAIDYVFYLSVSDDKETQNKLYKQNLNDLLAYLPNDVALKSDLLTTILYNFNEMENGNLMKYVLNEYYLKLPETYQNKEVIKNTQHKLKLALGNIAPDFSWKENGVTQNLSSFDAKTPYYLLIFWSTTCSHCLHEIPLAYEFTKSRKDVHVIGFTMENDDLGFKKYAPKYKEWTNILGLGKWQNKTARRYEIHATPTYFILDKNKKIVAKPDHFNDVKKFFNR